MTDPVRRVSARKIFWASNRFDLIFKLKTLVDSEGFKFCDKKVFENYLKHIDAFNCFFEEEPRKTTPLEFLESFKKTFRSIKSKRFKKEKSIISVESTNQLYDGAHRLSVCSFLNLPIFAKTICEKCNFDYQYFLAKGLDPVAADLHALFYIQENPSLTLGILHSVANFDEEKKVDKIICEKHNIYYKKAIRLSLNGYINLKKINYGAVGKGESWIGSEANKFAGALQHAKGSFGDAPVRLYVIGEKPAKMVPTKLKIRDYLGRGNYSFHTTDSRKEALLVGEMFLNKNTKHFYESFPYGNSLAPVWGKYQKLQRYLKIKKISPEDLILVGSAALDLFGLRVARDMDYLALKPKVQNLNSPILSFHGSEARYYMDLGCLVYDPRQHVRICGVKILSLRNTLRFKSKRREFPKDIFDILRILAYFVLRRGFYAYH